MPLKYYQCPTGERILAEECLTKCQQLEGRCASLPYLHHIISHQRIWSGVPSTTQCLNGTRLEYLKITEDYTLDPDDHAYAVLGTRHHERLQAVADKLGMTAEMKLSGEVSGILDLLEPDEQKPDFFKGEFQDCQGERVEGRGYRYRPGDTTTQSLPSQGRTSGLPYQQDTGTGYVQRWEHAERTE